MVLRLLFPIFLGISIFILLIQSLKLLTVDSNGMVGPGFLPTVLALLILVLLAIELFSLFRKERNKDTKDKKKVSFLNFSPQLTFIIAISLTLAFVNVLGMLISLGLFFFFVLFRMEKRSLLESVLFTIISILIIYIIFDVLLDIPFPMGFLG